MQLTPPFHHHWKSSSTFFGEYLGQFLLVELHIYILKYTLQALHIAPFLLLTRPTVLYSQLLHIVLIYPFVLLSRSFLGQRLLTISWISTFWDFDLGLFCNLISCLSIIFNICSKGNTLVVSCVFSSQSFVNEGFLLSKSINILYFQVGLFDVLFINEQPQQSWFSIKSYAFFSKSQKSLWFLYFYKHSKSKGNLFLSF